MLVSRLRRRAYLGQVAHVQRARACKHTEEARKRRIGRALSLWKAMAQAATRCVHALLGAMTDDRPTRTDEMFTRTDERTTRTDRTDELLARTSIISSSRCISSMPHSRAVVLNTVTRGKPPAQLGWLLGSRVRTRSLRAALRAWGAQRLQRQSRSGSPQPRVQLQQIRSEIRDLLTQ